MAGRYKRRDAQPLASLPPENVLHSVNHSINRLLVAFLISTLVFALATAILAQIAPNDINQTVWERVIAELIIASVFFFYAYLWRKGKFWGYWRLLTTSGWGALVAISIIILSGKYPVWVRFEQILQCTILVLLVWILVRPSIRKHFAKK